MKSINLITLVITTLFLAAINSTEAQTPIFGNTRAQSEPYIAVNPTDTTNIIGTVIILAGGGSPNEIACYYSFNTGQSWTQIPNLSGAIAAGDPVIAFDPDGTAYLLYQVITASGLYLRKSTDGGITWSSPTTVILYNPSFNTVDRPWMSISSIRNANGFFDIYISHTLFDVVPFGEPPVSEISLLKSNNGGSSFSVVHSVTSASGFTQGSSVAAGPAGEVFLAWAGLNTVSGAAEVISMKRSTDGGVTFSSLNTITAYQIGTKSGDGFILSSEIRADSYPRLAIDNSPGAYRGYAYVTWSGKQSPSGNPDVLMVRWKKNAGGSFEWSNVEVVEGSTGEQWMPAVGTSPDGVISILYYSNPSSASGGQIYTYLKSSTNGGQNFSTATLVGTSTGFNVTVGEKFVGDYFGLACWFGKAHALWSENQNHGSNNRMQAYYRAVTVTQQTPSGYKYVKVNQVDEAGLPFEKFGRWNQGAFTNYKAPHRFLFRSNPSSNEVMRAKQNFKIGSTQKYNKWSIDNDVINHRVFTIDPLTPELRSQFKTANNATLRTEVIDGGSLNIEFRDPWLIDDSDTYGPKNRGQSNALWYSKPSPFSPNTTDPNYKGVFLNQFFTDGIYYSVRPANQTINGLSWFLWNWVTTGATATQPTSSETPVVFTANNADVKARLKLRLGSSISSATASNGQRKLVYTSYAPAKFHLVYESAGEIYYTFSTDNGATWSNEILLSSNDGNNKYPSIAAYQNKVYVVWQRTTSTNNYTIYVRRYTGSSWATRQTLGTASLTTGNNPLPVITMKEVYVGGLRKIRVLSVWKGASALRFRTSDDDGATWDTEASVPNTLSGAKNPSLAAGLFFDYGYQGAYLTYDDGSLIRLATYSTSWATTETPPGSITSNANSSHVTAGATEGVNAHAHVVWQGNDPNSGTAAVFYQRKSGYDGTWSAVQSFVSSGFQRPAITHMLSNNLAMLWDKNGSLYKATYTYSTNSWSAAQNVGTGQYPTPSAAFGSSHPAAKYAYMVNSSAPYKIQISAESLQKPTEEGGKYYRRVAVADTTGSIFLMDLGDVYCKTTKNEIQPLAFVAVNDTLLTLQPDEYWNYLETGPVTITNETDSLIVEERVFTQNAEKFLAAGESEMRISLEVINAESNRKLANLGNAEVVRKNGRAESRRRLKTSFLAGTRVLLRPVVENIAKGKSDLMYSLIHVHDYSHLGKHAGSDPAQQQNRSLTAGYRFGPIYPNPFNPTATITYSLPEEGSVILKVFDVLGHEVATLLDERQAAGEYRVPLDGGNWVSGVYLCRLQAGNFSRTVKVTLVK
jgi:hypothetical protein